MKRGKKKQPPCRKTKWEARRQAAPEGREIRTPRSGSGQERPKAKITGGNTRLESKPLGAKGKLKVKRKKRTQKVLT